MKLPTRGAPSLSKAWARKVVSPPSRGMRLGWALSSMKAARPPISTSIIASPAAPENAWTAAVPTLPSPVRVASATPLELVLTSSSISPRLVERVISVPPLTGVPSSLRARIVIDEVPKI
jgi:hypothetical protein